MVALIVMTGCAATCPSRAAPASSFLPDSAFGAYLAAEHAERARDDTTAAVFFDRALAADPTNENLIRHDFLLRLATGRIAEAVPLARRIVASDGPGGLPGLVLIEQALRAGKYAAAADAAAAMPREGAQRFAAPLLLAWAEIGRGNLAAAQQAVDSLSGDNGLVALHDLHAAMIGDFTDHIDAAAAAYAALTSGAQIPSLRIVELAGNFFERHGRSEDAARLYRRVSGEQGLADVATAGLQRIKNGTVPPRLIATPAEGAAEGLFDLAGLLNAPETVDAALIYARLALDLAPHFALADMLVAELRDDENRPADALSFYQAVDPHSPYAWLAQLRTALELDSLGRTEQAIALLKGMAAKRPSSTEPVVELGDILRSHKRFNEAIDAYDQAIARTPHPQADDWRLFYSRGVAFERTDRWPRAEIDLKHALALQPDQPLVLNYLGYSWIDRGEHLDEALGMVRRAVALQPDDGYMVDSLGWAYFRLKDFSQATQYLEHAIELLPEDPTINDHLGDAYWRVGRQLEARYQWQRALLFRPEADEAKGIEAKLDHGLAAPSTASNGG